MTRHPKKRLLSTKGTLLEAAFQDQVVDLARLGGWARIYHAPHGADRGRIQLGQIPEGRGFPDLVLVRAPELLVRELKTDTGPIGPGQQDWLDDLRACGLDVDLWRPRDIDAIKARLLAPRPRRAA